MPEYAKTDEGYFQKRKVRLIHTHHHLSDTCTVTINMTQRAHTHIHTQEWHAFRAKVLGDEDYIGKEPDKLEDYVKK